LVRSPASVDARQCRAARKTDGFGGNCTHKDHLDMRTTRENISFESPFSLTAVDEVQPAGAYMVEVDEELIEGLSFLAYRRVATTIYLPVRRGGAGSIQAVRVDPAELDAARGAKVPAGS
jgi:hypothetical protein